MPGSSSPPFGGGLCIGCIGPISRSGPVPPFNVLRTRSLANIATKLNALNAAATALNTVTHLGPSALSVERSEIAATIEALTALKYQVSDATDIGLLRSEAETLVNYADVGTVIVPKVVLLQSADTILRGTDTLAGQISSLQTRINTADTEGKAVGAAQAALNNVETDATQATSIANGLMASVPLISGTDSSQLSADANQISQARTSLSAAQSGIAVVSATLQASGG